MTKPRTVPSTVRIAFETDSLCVVISDTSETTVSVREIEHTSTYHEVSTEKMSDSLAATAVKNSTSGQISLMTVALNFFKLHPTNSGFWATIVCSRSRGAREMWGFSDPGRP